MLFLGCQKIALCCLCTDNIPLSRPSLPETQDLSASISPNNLEQQFNLGIGWEAASWNGACDELANIAKPTLVITGTDDNGCHPHANSLIIAGKITGAWFIQIENAGHVVMSQYPDETNKILQIFLSTTTQPEKDIISCQTVQNSRMQTMPLLIMQD